VLIDSNPYGTRRWEKAVAYAARAHYSGPQLDGPLEVEITFFLARPKGHFGKRGLLPSAPEFPAVKPDVDKLARSTIDALHGAVFANDSRVVHLRATKLYARAAPGAFIRVRPFDPTTKEMESHAQET
jgi:Holliday junction resolvase RusA-like endonuclease